MAHDLSREDLKRNELGEALEAGFHFAEGHVRMLLAAVGGILALVLVVWGVFAWRTSRAEAASESLGAALRAAGAEIVETGANPDHPVTPTFPSATARDARARELFEKTVAEHGSTGAGHAARLRLAEMAFAAGDRAGARQRYEQVLEGSSGSLAATARVGLAELARAEGRGAELAGELEKELASGQGALPVDALLGELARTYEALGRGADARATWQRLADEHPASAYAGLARQRLAALASAA
jgi:hypothetical protein